MSSAALGSVVINLGGAALRLVVQATLANWLGVVGYGRFVVMRGWGGLLGRLPNRGYHLAMIRWLPQYAETGESDAYRRLVRHGVRSTVAWSIGLAAGAMAFSALVLGDTSWATMVGLGLIVSVAAMQIHRQIFQASFRHVLGVTSTELAHPAVFAVLALIFAALAGRSVSAALLALGIAGVIVAVGQAVVVERTLPQAEKPSANQARHVSDDEWRKGTAPLFVGQLGIAGLEVSFLLIVGAILGPGAAGIYAVAQRIAVLGRMGNSAIESVIGPQFSRLSTGGPEAARNMQAVVDRGIRLSVWFTTAAGVALVLGADLALRLFGPDFSEGRNLLWVLLIGNMVNALSGPTGYLVSMTGSEVVYGYVMAGHAALAALAASLVAWQTGSLIGVALVATVATISWNVWLIRIGGTSLGVWCLPRLVRRVLRIGVLA